jgi:hypothetical protein
VHHLVQKVRAEWQAAERGFNPHGLTDANLVTPPQRKQFRNSFFAPDAAEPFRRTPTLDLWIVVDETPGGDGGYLMVFDEERETYGLAVKPDLFLGYYGTLAETIVGM